MTDISQILFKIAQDVGHLVGTMDAMKQTLENHANENDTLKKKIEKLEEQQQNTTMIINKAKWTIFGISLAGAFGGTKIAEFFQAFSSKFW